MIHLLRLFAQILDLQLFGSNVPPQVLNLLIKDEFELFEFLSAPFKGQDCSLLMVDDIVLMVDLVLLLVEYLLEILVYFFQIVLLHRLLLDHPIELCELILDLTQLVLG